MPAAPALGQQGGASAFWTAPQACGSGSCVAAAGSAPRVARAWLAAVLICCFAGQLHTERAWLAIWFVLVPRWMSRAAGHVFAAKCVLSFARCSRRFACPADCRAGRAFASMLSCYTARHQDCFISLASSKIHGGAAWLHLTHFTINGTCSVTTHTLPFTKTAEATSRETNTGH